MPAPSMVKEPRQLLVEGNDQRNFFETLSKHLRIQEIQIQNYGGVNELRRFLAAFVKFEDFDLVESIGIVRDAEASSQAAFTSVLHSLRFVGLTEPKIPCQYYGDSPKVGVLILGDEEGTGMLESILLRTVQDRPQHKCVVAFMSCLEEIGVDVSRRREKRLAHAYISGTGEPHISVGVAAMKRVWNLDHIALRDTRKFLVDL